MKIKALLAQLVEHMRWADLRSAGSLRCLTSPPENAVRMFAHVAAAEKIYMARVSGQDPFPQDFWPALSLDEAWRVAETAAASLESYLHHVSPDDLWRPVVYRNSAGTYFETPPAQMLMHLALHGEHHRGQVARLVKEAGGEPALTDLIALLREQPERRTSGLS